MSDQLVDAVALDDLTEVKRLLSAGADANSEDGMPVFLAILSGNADILRALIDAGGFCADLGVKRKSEVQP